MGKKNRNKGGRRDKYDDMFDDAGGSDYGYYSQDDENYRYSYQNEIDSVEFVSEDGDADNEYEERDFHTSSNNTQNSNSYPSQNKSRNAVSEERDAWNFAQKQVQEGKSNTKSDTTSSKKNATNSDGGNVQNNVQNNVRNNEEDKIEEATKEDSPKTPGIGERLQILRSGICKRIACISSKFKRTPKTEVETIETSAEGETRLQSDNVAEVVPAPSPTKPGLLATLMASTKKMVSTQGKKPTSEDVNSENVHNTEKSEDEKKVDNAPNLDVTAGMPEKTPEDIVRENKKTYLIVGSITVAIVVLLMLAGGILLFSKSGRTVAKTENAERIENVENTKDAEVAKVAEAAEKATSTVSSQETSSGNAQYNVQQSDDFNTTVLPNDLETSNLEENIPQISTATPDLDDLGLDTALDSNFADSIAIPNEPEDLPDISEIGNEVMTENEDTSKEETSLDVSQNLDMDGSLENLKIDEAIMPVTPVDTEDLTMPKMASEITDESKLETVSKNEMLQETADGNLPSGTATSSPTLATAENSRTVPKELETETGVMPGSNVPEWNSASDEEPIVPLPSFQDDKTATEEIEALNPSNSSEAKDSVESVESIESLVGTDLLEGVDSGKNAMATDATIGDVVDNSTTHNDVLNDDVLNDSVTNAEETENLLNPASLPIDQETSTKTKTSDTDTTTQNHLSDDLTAELGLDSGLKIDISDSAETEITTDDTSLGIGDDTSIGLDTNPVAIPDLDAYSETEVDDLGNLESITNSKDLEGLEITQRSPDTHFNTNSANQVNRVDNTNGDEDVNSAKFTSHRVSKGETYWTISEKYYKSPSFKEALARYNNDVVPDANNLKEGTLLQIPELDFLRSCYPTLCPQSTQFVQMQEAKSGNTIQIQYYCVKEGDTLSELAERLLGDISRWPEIYRLNEDKIPNQDMLPAGIKLQIPTDTAIPNSRIWQ